MRRSRVAITEKVHAMLALGLRNSRMRDFFDIHALARARAFGGETLAMAISSTFGRRGTEIPRELPAALTHAFAKEPGKQAQWTSFLTNNGKSRTLPKTSRASSLSWPIFSAQS